MEWQFYRRFGMLGRRLKPPCPPRGLRRVVFAVVRFPRVAEPGEWWVERAWVAAPWIFPNGLFGVSAGGGGCGFAVDSREGGRRA